jgi:hypothetical protein
MISFGHRPFTVSARRLGEGTSMYNLREYRGLFSIVCFFLAFSADVALSQKLAEELQYEKVANDDSSEPEFLTAFKAEGIWQVSIPLILFRDSRPR